MSMSKYLYARIRVATGVHMDQRNLMVLALIALTQEHRRQCRRHLHGAPIDSQKQCSEAPQRVLADKMSLPQGHRIPQELIPRMFQTHLRLAPSGVLRRSEK